MGATSMLTYLRLFVRVLHKLFSLDGVHIENGKRDLKSSWKPQKKTIIG